MSDKPKKDKKDKKKVDPKYDYDIYMNQIKEGKFIAIGGHHQYFQISPDDPRIILKQTHKSEMEFYEKINDPNAPENWRKLKEFVPEYFGYKIIEKARPATDVVDFDGSEQYPLQWQIGLHYLPAHFKDGNCSGVDVKISDTYITTWALVKGDAAIQKRKEKESRTTHPKYFFNLIGYILRDNDNGNFLELYRKRPYFTYDQSVESFRKLFLVDHGVKGNSEYNIDALDTCISFLKKIIAFFSKKGQWPYDTKGTSIIFFVNNKLKTNSCQIKLIDWASVEPMGPDYIDVPFVKGCENLMKMFQSFKDESQGTSSTIGTVGGLSSPSLDDESKNQKFPLFYIRSLMFKSIAGSIIGYSIGTYAKEQQQKIIQYGCMTFSMFFVLIYKQWIQIQWLQIGSDMVSVVTRTRNERWLGKLFNFIFTTLPSAALCFQAFKYGFKHNK